MSQGKSEAWLEYFRHRSQSHEGSPPSDILPLIEESKEGESKKPFICKESLQF